MNSKNTTYLTKVFSFCAAHQYGNEKWTEQENWDVFGKDTRVHGHNYTLHVTVTGEINPDSGFLVDLGHLKKIVNEQKINGSSNFTTKCTMYIVISCPIKAIHLKIITVFFSNFKSSSYLRRSDNFIYLNIQVLYFKGFFSYKVFSWRYLVAH